MTTVWCVEPFGRGGIARYAADIAAILAEGGMDARVATTTGGPADPCAVPHEIWLPRRGPGPVGKAAAAGAGLVALRRRPGRDDVVWLPLGVRPRVESAMVRAAAASGAKVVVTVHNRRPHDSTAGEDRVIAAAMRADLVVVHTEAMETWARSRGLTALRLTFPPPQEAEAPAGRLTRASLGFGPDDVVLVVAGTLRPYKGVDVLLDALAAADNPSVRVLLAGQVSAPDELDATIRRLGIEGRVHVEAGFLSGGELLDVLELADAIALPYRSIDHSGIGALAADRGLPAVGSDLPGVRELFGSSGLYVPPGDAVAMARLLERLPEALPPRRPPGRLGDDLMGTYRDVLRRMIDER